jgi:hypothetical protein
MSTRRWLWALAALAIAAAGACIDDEAGPTSIAGGKNAIYVGMDFGTLNPPGGDALMPFPPVQELDTVNNPNDLFGRGAPDRNPVFVYNGDLDIDASGPNDRIANRYWWDEFRLPRLRSHDWDDDYAANMDMIEFERPDRDTRIGRWDYRSDIDYTGGNNEWYVVGLARYGTEVRGLVDHLEILVYDGEVVEPDSLVLLGGAPGGYPDHLADFGLVGDAAPPDDYCPDVPAGANPFILGHFKTGPTPHDRDTGANFDGETDADLCFMGNGLWQAGFENDLHPDSIPFAPNNFESFDLPQYNFMVFWAYDSTTNTVLYDRPHMRAQVGIALDLEGNPLPHGFAPFPGPPGHEQSEFASYDDFLDSPQVTQGVVSLDMVAYNLKPLSAGSAYQVWLFNEVDNNVLRVSPTYTLQRPDTVGFDELGNPDIEWVDAEGPATVTEFTSAAGYRNVIQLSTADIGSDMSDFSYAVITVGSGGDANPLESPVPSCFRYLDKTGTEEREDDAYYRTGTLTSFCTGLATGRDDWYAFGSGDVQFLSDTAVAIGLNRLARPPLGYYYGVWVRVEEKGTDQGPGPISAFNLGAITTAPPDMESLEDADVMPSNTEYLTDTEIFTAGKYFLWADLPSTFSDACIGTQEGVQDCSVLVTLEPKAGDPNVMGSTVIFAASVPKQLDSDRLKETESR